MLAGAHQPSRSRAADVRLGEAAYEIGALTKGTCVDDRVERVGVHVQHGPENHVDADRPRLGAKHLTELEGKVFGAGGSERHYRREGGSTTLREKRWECVDIAEPHPRSVLHV